MVDKKVTLEQKVELNINLDTTPIVYTDNIIMNANEET